MSILVVYYSWTGNTRIVAKKLAQVLGADLEEIQEVKERKGVLGYIGGGYLALRGKSSPIKPVACNLEKYQIVLIGTPVWAARPCPAINTFLSKVNLAGKKVAVFVTMGAGGDKKAQAVLKKKIEQKGGQLCASFSVKTGGVEVEDVEKAAGEIAKNFSAQIHQDG